MDDDLSYYKDGVDRVRDLMRETFGDYFKAYFSGQPEDLDDTLLPCIMVSESEGSIQSGATGTDDITESILIIVAMNKKQDMGAPVGAELTETKIRKLIKGQDPDTSWPYEYRKNTVMYAVRKHITMNEAVLRSSIRTNFALNVRGPNLITQEGYVTITVERCAAVPFRD